MVVGENWSLRRTQKIRDASDNVELTPPKTDTDRPVPPQVLPRNTDEFLGAMGEADPFTVPDSWEEDCDTKYYSVLWFCGRRRREKNELTVKTNVFLKKIN